MAALFRELAKPHPNGFSFMFRPAVDHWVEERAFTTEIYLVRLFNGDHLAVVTWLTETPEHEVEQRHVRQVLAAWDRAFGPSNVQIADDASMLTVNPRLVRPDEIGELGGYTGSEESPRDHDRAPAQRRRRWFKRTR
ncbi:MAG: hypothetical protein M3340_19610 [Actinomycetota bacterium]|nr:hypothetical protein [Actinomycetota bacterium]